MAIVLIMVPLVRLGGIVLAASTRVRRQNGCALIEIKRHLALQTNGVAKISACRKMKRAAAGRSNRFYGSVDGWIIYCGAVALRAECANVIKGLKCSSRSWSGLGRFLGRQSGGRSGCRASDTGSRKMQELPARTLLGRTQWFSCPDLGFFNTLRSVQF